GVRVPVRGHGQPGTVGSRDRRGRPKHRRRMGFMNSFSALGGVLISPLVGRLIDFTKSTGGDWSMVFLLHGGFYFLAAVSWLIVDPSRPLQSSGATHAV